MMRNYIDILTGLLIKIAQHKTEKQSAGSKLRLQALMEDIGEVTEIMRTEVLERAKQEAALDIDVDVNYANMAEQFQAANQEGTDMLTDVLRQIDAQLSRRHKSEEYERLYELEKQRYMNSGSYSRARQNFTKWFDDVCYSSPNQEDVTDYITEKLLHLFEKGVFNTEADHMQRTTRYTGEFDFDHLDDDHKLKKTVYKHYAALRRLVGYSDGQLVVNTARAGQFFYVNRHAENAKTLRSAFLKYMHKIDMAQDVRRKMQKAEAENADIQQDEPIELNYFAPTKNLKRLLTQEWFRVLSTDDKKYNEEWVEAFVDALMASPWREHIAREWAVKDRRLTLKCMIIGVLKDVGVLKGSYKFVARQLEMDDENPATLAKYMGMGKKQPFASWIELHSGTDPTVSFSD